MEQINFENLELKEKIKKINEEIKKIENIKKESINIEKITKHEKEIKLEIEEIKKEIDESIKKLKQNENHSFLNLNQMNNLLAQAIYIAITENDIEKALDFIYKTNNPYLIDAFHDLLIGHFLSLLKNTKSNK